MRKIHNQLRSRFEWYHRWHNFNYHTHIHFLIFSIFSFFIILLVFSQIFPLFSSPDKSSNYQIFAQSDSKTLTSQADWQAGSSSNGSDLTTTFDSMQLSPEYQIPLSDKTISASKFDLDKEKLVDGDINTAFGGDSNVSFYWQVDLGDSYTISKARTYNANADTAYSWKITSSNDGINWTDRISYYNTPGWQELTFPLTFNAIYIRLETSTSGPNHSGLCNELELYTKPSFATHTSATTQIGDVSADTGRYVVYYQGFKTTETQPANTSIDYRFRLVTSAGSSTDGWTDWTGGDVANLSASYPNQLTITQSKIDKGETYLQVETKFERDATTTNTPVVNEYTVQYHTNKPPNAPTPQ